jgi:serine/threonine protein kinase
MHNDVKFLIDATSGQGGHDYQGLIKFHGAYHSKSTGQIFIVLEYMSAGSLQDVLAKVSASVAALDWTASNEHSIVCLCAACSTAAGDCAAMYAVV